MFTVLAIALLLAVPSPVHSLPARGAAPSVVLWDATGHRAMAAIAYDRLRPATRARVDALMRSHPDLDSLSVGLDVGSHEGARELFLRASVWPDVVRRDRRFYTETDTASVPTPLLPGFPFMARRAGWHYLTRSFSTDGTPTQSLQSPNATTVLPVLADALADAAVPASVRAYNLSWIVHIVGDLHQPLHGTSRATAARPDGDAGGNAEWVQPGATAADTMNLHAVWDGLLGRDARALSLDSLVGRLMAGLPPSRGGREVAIPDGAALAETVRAWADESATLARYVAYEFPARRPGDSPPRLSSAYVTSAVAIARQRVTLAGYRLAALLEARIG